MSTAELEPHESRGVTISKPRVRKRVKWVGAVASPPRHCNFTTDSDMSGSERPSTRSVSAAANSAGSFERAPLTPETKQRIETNRLKAKAIREAHLAAEKVAQSTITSTKTRATTSQKRTYSQISSVRESDNASSSAGPSAIQPARKFQRKDFIEFDFSKIRDTKGGFLSTEDDPHSTLSALNLQDKPSGMSLEEWSRHQLRLKLQKEKTGVYEPGISALKDTTTGGQKKCYDCGSLEIDWKWLEVFKCRVCNKCKESVPEKYSLLTKTEAREDYLLTDPELRDADLLPHLEKPNPHKSTWNNMMLYLRYQVEAHAVKKWDGLENLDKEFEKRGAEKKRRKDEKFRTKLRDLKKKTRVESWKKGGMGGVRHEHVWGVLVEGEEEMGTRTCEECGLEVEEMVF